MKTRTGFVSNSSSSSFVIIATEDAFEEALSRIEDERYQKLVRYLAKKKTCFGQQVRVIKEFTDAGGFSAIWGCDSDNESEILRNAKVDRPNEEDYDLWYPSECLSEYETAIDNMRSKPEWKDKIIYEEVGDGG